MMFIKNKGIIMLKKIICKLFIKVFGEMTEEEKYDCIHILEKLAESAAQGAVKGAKSK